MWIFILYITIGMICAIVDAIHSIITTGDLVFPENIDNIALTILWIYGWPLVPVLRRIDI